MDCALEYIPEHLHTNDKPIIEGFSIGEDLYYRCKPEKCSKPYDSISLYDISHNRNFGRPDEFPKNDVLFNIAEEDSKELYDLEIVTLRISELEDEATYVKEIVSRNDPHLKAIITLRHAPIPCMYPHSVFEVSINDTTVDRINFDSILNKGNRTYKNLRSDIRQELTSIIQTGNIDSSEDIEYIENP